MKSVRKISDVAEIRHERIRSFTFPANLFKIINKFRLIFMSSSFADSGPG